VTGKDQQQARVRDKRRYKRELFNYKIELVNPLTKMKIKCASFDLSEGGIRVVTDIELKDPKYIVIIDKFKLNAKLIYEEARKSTMMERTAYYHGLEFEKPIDSATKVKLLKDAEKFSF